MKIIHIFKTYFPETQGGLQEAIRQISFETSKRGFENVILTLRNGMGGKALLSLPEGQVRRSKETIDIASCPISIEMARSFSSLIKDADVLHYHFPWPFADILHLAWKPKIPAIATYHSDIVRQRWLKILYHPVMKRFLGNMQKIVVTSEQYLATSRDLRPFQSKCKVIPLCLSEKRWPELGGTFLDEIRSKYGQGFLLFVGVLRYYKGLKYLIAAMKDLDINLIIIGDGPERRNLELQAKKAGARNIEFLGYVEDKYLPAFYQLCKAVVSPSCERAEAFGMVLIEGLMFRKPLISTELGTATSYVNKHGQTGIVVPPRDSKSLHFAIKEIIEDEMQYAIFARNARKRYEELFTPGRVGDEYERLYKWAIQKDL